MSAPFRRVAVVGLGLLGGSVGSAARARGVAREVFGAARRAQIINGLSHLDSYLSSIILLRCSGALPL